MPTGRAPWYSRSTSFARRRLEERNIPRGRSSWNSALRVHGDSGLPAAPTATNRALVACGPGCELPGAGVEPARPVSGSRDFKSLASANSATPARPFWIQDCRLKIAEVKGTADERTSDLRLVIAGQQGRSLGRPRKQRPGAAQPGQSGIFDLEPGMSSAADVSGLEGLERSHGHGCDFVRFGHHVGHFVPGNQP